MLERAGPILKLLCLGLGLLLVYQLSGLVARKNPLKNLSIPIGLSSSKPAAQAGDK
jgi:hypothetical protein